MALWRIVVKNSVSMKFFGSTTNPHVIIQIVTVCCPYERI